MPMIIALAIAFVVGLGLQKLISSKVVLPGSAIDYGRVWSGWVVFFATLVLLTGFLIYLDLERLAVWALGVLVYGGCAFGAGWAYGKFFKGDAAESIEAERSLKPSSHFKETSNQPQDEKLDPVLQLEDEGEKDKIKNPYEVLEVSPLASIEVIESAYQALIKKYHPETGESANEIRYKEIISAYKALTEMENMAKHNAKYREKYVALIDANHSGVHKNPSEFTRNDEGRALESVKRRDGSDTYFSLEEHVNEGGRKLSNADLKGIHLNNISLIKAQMDKADISYSEIKHVDLTGADLSNAVCNEGVFINVKFSNVNLDNTLFESCIFQDCKLNKCMINNSTFKSSDFRGSSFEKTTIKNSDFSDSKLDEIVFYGSDAISSEKKITTIKITNFSNASLSKAHFYGKLDFIDFSSANLEGSVFNDSELILCNFLNSALESAKFVGSIIKSSTVSVRASFKNANLVKCDFSYSQIQDADFSQSKLIDANFNNCQLSNVTFPNNFETNNPML